MDFLENVPWSEIQKLGKLPYDYKIPYGDHELQFGELRLPIGKGPFPVVVFIHGGCWLSDFNLDHVSAVCADLTKEGFVCWTPEYRRLGNEGGGWPNTFLDIRKSIDFLSILADQYPINLEKMVLMGHSAGGHLALWVAAQHILPNDSDLYTPEKLTANAIFSLAGITDLEAYDKVNNSCSSSVTSLVGGKVKEVAQRYTEASPIHLLPNHITTRLVHGNKDMIVPIDQAKRFAQKSKKLGDDARLIEIKNAGHFDMAHPRSRAWHEIKKELGALG